MRICGCVYESVKGFLSFVEECCVVLGFLVLILLVLAL